LKTIRIFPNLTRDRRRQTGRRPDSAAHISMLFSPIYSFIFPPTEIFALRTWTTRVRHNDNVPHKRILYTFVVVFICFFFFYNTKCIPAVDELFMRTARPRRLLNSRFYRFAHDFHKIVKPDASAARIKLCFYLFVFRIRAKI